MPLPISSKDMRERDARQIEMLNIFIEFEQTNRYAISERCHSKGSHVWY